jgi:MFS family permease
MMAGGITRPLREPIYRRIWLASVLSNLGLMIGMVGAGWAMTQISNDATGVALVQTAAMLPMMLWSIPAGAIADMFDRRKVALAGLFIAISGAAGLSASAMAGVAFPFVILALIFLIGTGNALFGPAWQSSVVEQVPPGIMPQAIALNSISFNIGRSIGPAIGGTLVAIAGAGAAFLANMLFYLPLILTLLLWRRVQPASKLPPERLDRAIVTGMRYVRHSPPIRRVMIRALLMAVVGASASALMPLIARDLLGGGASIYGIILGGFGAGAIIGALLVPTIRDRMSSETAIRLCAGLMGLGLLVIGASGSIWLTVPALVITGAVWMLAMALFSISVQMNAPRWVTGRVLATLQASITGGMALGSWMSGMAADAYGIAAALFISGGLMLLTPLAGLKLRVPDPVSVSDDEAAALSEPDVAMPLTPRSGPIAIEVEYRVALDQARGFHAAMQHIQRVRQRNGAYGWSIARDISDPTRWTERYHFPTWLDYLRHRDRRTAAEHALQIEAEAFQMPTEPVRIRRMLDRPFGSVRWKESSPDTGLAEVLPLG